MGHPDLLLGGRTSASAESRHWSPGGQSSTTSASAKRRRSSRQGRISTPTTSTMASCRAKVMLATCRTCTSRRTGRWRSRWSIPRSPSTRELPTPPERSYSAEVASCIKTEFAWSAEIPQLRQARHNGPRIAPQTTPPGAVFCSARAPAARPARLNDPGFVQSAVLAVALSSGQYPRKHCRVSSLPAVVQLPSINHNLRQMKRVWGKFVHLAWLTGSKRMTDAELALQAVYEAQQILEEYLEPRPRNNERVILDKLVEVLERPDLLVAVTRMQGVR